MIRSSPRPCRLVPVHCSAMKFLGCSPVQHISIVAGYTTVPWEAMAPSQVEFGCVPMALPTAPAASPRGTLGGCRCSRWSRLANFDMNTKSEEHERRLPYHLGRAVCACRNANEDWRHAGCKISHLIRCRSAERLLLRNLPSKLWAENASAGEVRSIHRSMELCSRAQRHDKTCDRPVCSPGRWNGKLRCATSSNAFFVCLGLQIRESRTIGVVFDSSCIPLRQRYYLFEVGYEAGDSLDFKSVPSSTLNIGNLLRHVFDNFLGGPLSLSGRSNSLRCGSVQRQPCFPSPQPAPQRQKENVHLQTLKQAGGFLQVT
jgi:hypothetical protein